MKWTTELIDVIAVQATTAMHNEFDEYGEPNLKKIYPAIVPGMVRHVLDVAERIRAAAKTGTTGEEKTE